MIEYIAPPGLKIQKPKIQQLQDIAHKATTKYPTSKDSKLNTTKIENLYGQFGSWGV